MTAEVAVTVKLPLVFSNMMVEDGCPEMVMAGTSKKSLTELLSRSGIAAALVGER